MKLKKGIYVFLTLLTACVLSGCNRPQDENSDNRLTPTITDTPVTVTAAPTPNQTIESITVSPLETTELLIYTLNSDTLTKEAVSVLIPADSEVTPQLILDQVTDAMEDEAFYLGIDEVITEDKSVIVNFSKDAPPVCNVGASVEAEILDAIGQSLLENLPEYSKIIFRIEGEAYETGHIELGINEAYISR